MIYYGLKWFGYNNLNWTIHNDKYVIADNDIVYVQENLNSIPADNILGYYGTAGGYTVNNRLNKLKQLDIEFKATDLFYMFSNIKYALIYLNTTPVKLKDITKTFIYTTELKDKPYVDFASDIKNWFIENIGPPLMNWGRIVDIDSKWYYSYNENTYYFNDEEICKWFQMVWK